MTTSTYRGTKMTATSERPDESAYGSPEREATWRKRSWRFKLAYRRNVAASLLRGEISLRSCWFGLSRPHAVVALARREGRGMVYVCPAWITELDEAGAA